MRTMTVCAGVALLALSGVAPGRAADTPPALVGGWRDDRAALLPPGVAHFEAIRSDLVLAADGRFTLTVDRAAGALRQTGYYRVQGRVLTLDYPFGAVSYGLSRAGDTLTLRAHGASESQPITLRLSPAR